MTTLRGTIFVSTPITTTVLPNLEAQKFIRTDTTPDVTNHEYWITNNIAPVTVTNFDNGSICQSLVILGDGFTTIANNATIKTNTGANKLLAANKVYRLTNFNGIWIEDA